MAVNLGHALRLLTKTEVIVAELRPGMGSLGPDMGDPDPKALTSLLTGNMADLTRQKVHDCLFIHTSGLRLLCGSIHPKDATLASSIPAIETLVNRLSFLTPYLVLDLGAGLSPMAQKLLHSCDIIFVLVEPLINAVTPSRMLMDDITEEGIQKRSIKLAVANRIRSDTQLTMSVLEDQLGAVPAVVITPAPELMYMAVRNQTTAIATRPDSLTAQQFTKMASIVLEFEKQK